MTELIPYSFQNYNIVRNNFDNFTEIVLYKQSKIITRGNFGGIDNDTGEMFIKDFDKSRKWFEDNGVLNPLTDSATIDKLTKSIKSSRKRALDNLFGYALCNFWKYFVTLTFSPSFVNRDNDEDIKYHWQLFRQKLQYYFNDVTILAVPERHPTSGNLHLHCLVGSCDLTPYLKIAYNPHTNKPIKSNGRQVYNLSLFDFGFSTVVKCDSNQLKIVNYLTKYIIKDFGTIGYNKKSYFRTNNLFFKNKEYQFIKDKDITSFINDNKQYVYKETEDLIVYRVEH